MLLIVRTGSLKMFCFNKYNLNKIKCICFTCIYGQALVAVALKNGLLLVPAFARAQLFSIQFIATVSLFFLVL